MKKYEAVIVTLAFVFSLGCFAQSTNSASASPAPGKTTLLTDSFPTDDLVIQSYYVEERINKLFGGRIITYQVSKLDLVETYDLGPNNTRTVIPNYVKKKPKVAPNAIETKTTVASSSSVAPVKVEITAPVAAATGSKYVTVNMVDTYEKVIDKGYKSIDMLKKVADRFYFEGNLTAAAGYYTQLFDQAQDLDVIYYYRYAQSLKAINEDEKANTLMKRFKSETLTMK
ncbi:hypothetical protein D3C87_1072970 [compost metagenome]